MARLIGGEEMDQAMTLRQMREQTNPERAEAKVTFLENRRQADQGVKVFSITSGKGGVGKTHIVVNLAFALRRLGARVMIFDADLGLANVDVLLGLTPQCNIQHVLDGQKSLEEILIEGPEGIIILPASSGVQDLVDLSESQQLQLLAELDSLERDIDILLVDTGAGISSNVMYFNVAAQEIIVVVTPEPTSITDAYALMKVLATKYAEKHFKVLLNAVSDAVEAKEVFRRLSLVAERFLDISIDYLGFIVYDPAFSKAVRRQKALLDLYPHSAAGRCFQQLARHLMEIPEVTYPKGNIQFFWKRLLTRRSQPSPLFSDR
ncbi:MAG: MinD/ParA family protein [Nitrospinota bacterium]|nr:MAG: MinD/ParA family protein [Nitrospinota bacterium]